MKGSHSHGRFPIMVLFDFILTPAASNLGRICKEIPDWAIVPRYVSISFPEINSSSICVVWHTACRLSVVSDEDRLFQMRAR